MSHPNSKRRKPAAASVLVIPLACLGLAACGSSSSSSTSTSTVTAATSTSAAATGASATSGKGAKVPNAGRFAAMRECLRKNGIALPQRTSGQRRPPGTAGGFLGGGPGSVPRQLPKGVTRAQYEAALKKCGGVTGHVAPSGRVINNPVFKAALAKFATCLRQNGVSIPNPNTSGNGPVFNVKGLNTRSAKFKAAESKCRGVLEEAFRRGAGPNGSGAGHGGASSSGGK